MSLLCDIGATRGELSLRAAFEADRGQVVAVIGPNGSGKTTLLRCLSGLTPLTSGRIQVGDRTVADPQAGIDDAPERRPMAMVFQDLRLFPHLDAVDNVAFPLRAGGQGRRDRRRTAATWLERLGVAEVAGCRPHELSGGQAQRVAIARALAAEPQVVLLDEPASGLDVAARRNLRGLVAGMARDSGTTVVMVTHDPGAAQASDLLVVMDGGTCVRAAPPATVRAHPPTRFAADLIGVTVLEGTVTAGVLRTGSLDLTVTGTPDGPAVATIRPSAVAVHLNPPGGSARNVMAGVVTDIEVMGDRARLAVEGPVTVLADITARSLETMGLTTGSEVHLAVKATDIQVVSVPAGSTS